MPIRYLFFKSCRCERHRSLFPSSFPHPPFFPWWFLRFSSETCGRAGGYGAPTVALTALNGETAAMIGGQGGWVLNRHFVIGGALRGIAPRPDVSLQNRSPGDPESARIQLGYAGLLFEYIGAPSDLLHYGADLVVGGGNVELVDDEGFTTGPSVSDDSFERTGVFAAELGPAPSST